MTTIVINVKCDFSGQKHEIPLYVGDPQIGKNPVAFQSDYLSKERGAIIPVEVMNSLTEIVKIAKDNGVPIDEMLKYAIKQANYNVS